MPTYTIAFEIQEWHGGRPWTKQRKQAKASSPSEALAQMKDRTRNYHTRNMEIVRTTK
jgi:hypothetical protein